MARKSKVMPVPAVPIVPPTIFGRQMKPVLGDEERFFYLYVGFATVSVVQRRLLWSASLQVGAVGRLGIVYLEKTPQKAARSLERSVRRVLLKLEQLTTPPAKSRRDK